MDNKYCYMPGLEEMWEAHKFDILGRSEREERKKDETLEIFRGIFELSAQDIHSPNIPLWEGTLW